MISSVSPFTIIILIVLSTLILNPVNSALLKGDQVLNLENDSKNQRALMELDCVSRYQELEEKFHRQMSKEMSRIDTELRIKEDKLREEFAIKEAELISQIPNR